jgi:hypothetical protein
MVRLTSWDGTEEEVVDLTPHSWYFVYELHEGTGEEIPEVAHSSFDNYPEDDGVSDVHDVQSETSRRDAYLELEPRDVD